VITAKLVLCILDSEESQKEKAFLRELFYFMQHLFWVIEAKQYFDFQ
jgi:hypothetical protein